MIIRSTLIAALALFGANAQAEDPVAPVALEASKTQLDINVLGLAGHSGAIYVTVYQNDDSWLGDEYLLRHKAEIPSSLAEGEGVAVVLSLLPGEYAFTVFYDKNANGELDRNFIGIPKEPVALSNNAKAKFGPPKYKDARFTLGAETLQQDIRITKVK